LVTPLRKDGTFDEAGMKRLVKYLVGHGMNTLFVLGYCGEGRAFNRTERKRITEVARETAGKDILVISGVMGDSTQIIQEYSDDAADAGADMTLMTPTDFFFLTDEELKGLFIRLADNAKIPFMIYNCPENHHYANAEMMAELAKHPNIIALKQTSGVEKIQTMHQTIDPKENFIMLSGDEFVFYPAMTLGVQGFIMGGPGNIMPAKCNEILDNYRKGDNDTAREEYMKLISFFRELYTALPYPMVISQIKAVMEIAGICERWMKHPVKEVSDEHMRVIEDMLKRHSVKV